jgi:hypothetical protein
MRIRCQEKHKVHPLSESREVLSAQRSVLTLESVLRGRARYRRTDDGLRELNIVKIVARSVSQLKLQSKRA